MLTAVSSSTIHPELLLKRFCSTNNIMILPPFAFQSQQTAEHTVLSFSTLSKFCSSCSPSHSNLCLAFASICAPSFYFIFLILESFVTLLVQVFVLFFYLILLSLLYLIFFPCFFFTTRFSFTFATSENILILQVYFYLITSFLAITLISVLFSSSSHFLASFSASFLSVFFHLFPGGCTHFICASLSFHLSQS